MSKRLIEKYGVTKEELKDYIDILLKNLGRIIQSSSVIAICDLLINGDIDIEESEKAVIELTNENNDLLASLEATQSELKYIMENSDYKYCQYMGVIKDCEKCIHYHHEVEEGEFDCDFDIAEYEEEVREATGFYD